MEDIPEPLPGWRVPARILCLCFGGLIAGGAAYWLLSAWLGGPNWATTRGEIVQAGVDRRDTIIHQSSRQGGSYRSTTYSADIVYRYRVRGRDYTGFGIGDGANWNYGSQSSASAAIGTYAGGTVTVYYDPTNPERSALDPYALSWIPLFIGGFGLLLLGAGYALLRTEPARAEAEEYAAEAHMAEDHTGEA